MRKAIVAIIVIDLLFFTGLFAAGYYVGKNSADGMVGGGSPTWEQDVTWDSL